MSILCFRPIIFLILVQSSAYAQPKRKDSLTIKVCFGGISNGVISKYGHLEDSLAFTDSSVNDMLQIVSFKMSLACNGNVVNYLENKSGNKLTSEMKDAIKEVPPGCTITFQGIKALFNNKTTSGQPSDLDPGILKLTLK